MKKAAMLAVALSLWASWQGRRTSSAFVVRHPENIQAAIDKGVDINAIDQEGMTADLAAGYNGSPEVISILAKAGRTRRAGQGRVDCPYCRCIEQPEPRRDFGAPRGRGRHQGREQGRLDGTLTAADTLLLRFGYSTYHFVTIY